MSFVDKSHLIVKTLFKWRDNGLDLPMGARLTIDRLAINLFTLLYISYQLVLLIGQRSAIFIDPPNKFDSVPFVSHVSYH